MCRTEYPYSESSGPAERHEDELYVFKPLSASVISLVNFGWTTRPYLLPHAERELERQN